MSYVKQDESGGGDTYTLRAAQSGSDVDIQLDATTGADSDVKLKAGTNITLTEASDTITIDASGGSPGGSNTQVQFNDGGSFGGDDAFTYDKTNDRVKIGNATIEADSTAKLHVVGTDAGLTVERHDDGSSAGPTLNLLRHSDSPAVGDDTGQVNFRAEDSIGNIATYASIKSEIEDPTAASKDGRLTLRTLTNSTQTDAIVIDTKINSEVDHNFKGLIQVNGAAGTAGQVLTSQGSGSDPTWAAAGGGGISPRGYVASGNFTAQNLAHSRPWGTNDSSTGTSGDSNPSCRPFFISQPGTVATMAVKVTSGSSGNYLAGIYDSDANGSPNNLLGMASFAVSGGAGDRTATSFTAADGTTPKTIVLEVNTQYWYATVKESGNGSIRAPSSSKTPTLMMDNSTNLNNQHLIAVRDTSLSGGFEDTWDNAGSSVSSFGPGMVWVIMS